MLPYSSYGENFIHGIVHPAPGVRLHRDYMRMTRMLVQKSIDSGEVWYGEQGIASYFGIRGMIECTYFSNDELMVMADVPVWRLFPLVLNAIRQQLNAPCLRNLDDLVSYRRDWRPPAGLVYELRNGVQRYSLLVERCNTESKIVSETPGAHLLAGIMHEFIICFPR